MNSEFDNLLSGFLNDLGKPDMGWQAAVLVACVLVAKAEPCLGPVTHAGCGALCPGYARGCYGCFGPSDAPRRCASSPRSGPRCS